MPPDAGAAGDANAGAPLALRFADLFDDLGTDDLRYSARARELSGRQIAIEGFLSHSHGPDARVSLVDQPGLCADCSPVPAIALPGARAPFHAGAERPVRVIGRLDYGFKIAAGTASMLRIEAAGVLVPEQDA